ncbi:hypothetical protein [Streptomyces sp. NPDC059828]|uniref:hypothetical protein n=1 Tax=Streptomyces sp. NPDC059828 TaxID=3346965 RepID=UPI003648611D
MTKRSIRRHASALLIAFTMAGGMGVGVAGSAQASPHPTAAAAEQAANTKALAPLRATAGPAHLPYYGSNADFPTWFFGATRLCVKNLGTQYGEARVQTRLNAPPEYIPVQAGRTLCVSRWWGGVPINVRNNAQAPLSVTAS